MEDVCGYEEKDPRVVTALKSGYPRFVVHAYIRELTAFYLQRAELSGRTAFLIPGRRATQDLITSVEGRLQAVEVDEALFLVHCDQADQELSRRAAKFVQHTGVSISSRNAEDLLLHHGRRDVLYPEACYVGNAQSEAERLLAQQIGCRERDVLLCASGMSAFYAAFRAVQELQLSRGRKRWLQLGWLYLDSGCILKEFLGAEESLECCYNVFELDVVLEKIRSFGDDLAAVVVECPTNPLIQVCELRMISEAVKAQGAVMIVDPTIASVYNVDVLPFADLLVTSLTKYAATEGDVMIGALALNPQSLFYGDLVSRISAFHQPPYMRDLSRLVREMESAPQLVAQMNVNAAKLAVFLRGHPAVKKVYYAGCADHIEDVAKSETATGAVITIELIGSMEVFYDTVGLMKGPSFGAKFTLLCPFVYLAHYDLVTAESGRKFLASVGIDPELIRISVGAEPYETIEAVFGPALDACID